MKRQRLWKVWKVINWEKGKLEPDGYVWVTATDRGFEGYALSTPERTVMDPEAEIPWGKTERKVALDAPDVEFVEGV